MKLVSSSMFFIVVTAIASIAVINQPTSLSLTSNANKEVASPSKSYILQGATPERLNKLVDSVGGYVSREFPIINAVSAMLTPNQADKIRAYDGVRIQDDRTVMTSGNGNLKEKNIPPGLVKKFNINNYIVEQSEADRLHEAGITGDGVTVAVVDSGTNLWGKIGSYLFRDTNGQQRVAVKYDAFRGRPTYYYNDDQNGHGTHVSGIIASSLKDEDGNYNGIAPDVYLLSVKAFDKNGESSYSKVLDALNWIFENRYRYKIRVVNMSLGAKVQSYYWQDPINQAVMRLWQAGVVVVSSAGNNGEDMGITVPGNNPYVLTVGAVTDSDTPYDMSDDRVTTFSAKGPSFEGFVKPEVVAYGNTIASKMDERYFRQMMKLSSKGQNYSEISGTSQAAALVSGIAALIISNDQYITPDDVKCKIMSTARAANNTEIATYSPFQQGMGLVNAYDAVMSNATGCANGGLNIEEDLLGTNHFVGPAKVDSNGTYYLEMPDGTILTEGMHWGDGDLGVQGMHWGDGDLGVQGMHWGDGDLGVQGMHWGDGDLSVQGMHWSDETMALKGMHWGEGDLSVQGMHWDNGDLGVQGMHWGEGNMDLQSTDLELEPIDPTIVVPIVTDGWQ